MAIPAGMQGVTVTGAYTYPDGSPMTGSIVFKPGSGSIVDSTNNIVVQGSVRVTLDVNGHFSVQLIASDSAGVNPTPFQYLVTPSFDGATALPKAYLFPAASPLVDMADVTEADPSLNNYVVVTGPRGTTAPLKRSDFPPFDPGLYSGSFTPTLAQTSTDPTNTIAFRPPLVALSGSGNTIQQRGAFAYSGTLSSDLAISTSNANYVVSLAVQPHATGNENNAWGVKFRTASQLVYVRFLYLATTDAIQILVNGKRLWANPQVLSAMSGIGSLGFAHILTLDLGSAASRDIQVEMNHVPFWGVYTSNAYPVVGASPGGLSVASIGDSITGGSNVNSGAGIGTWLYRFGHRAAASRLINACRGGTGFTAVNGAYTAMNDSARWNSDVVAKSPDVVFVWGGYNDSGDGSDSTWQGSVDTVLSGIKNGLPNAMVIMVGCWSPTGPWGASVTPASLVGKDTNGRARARVWGIPFISPITGDIVSSTGVTLANLGPWITGTGHVTATTGFGNADWVVGSASDAVHPTDAGADYIAQMMFDSMMLLLTA